MQKKTRSFYYVKTSLRQGGVPAFPGEMGYNESTTEKRGTGHDRQTKTNVRRHSYLLIVDYGGPDDVTIVQEARRAAGFGEEVFTQGELSFTSIRQMVRIINGFRRIMADYEVEEVMVYATAVLREAKNSRMILDLIRVHTGLSVEILDMPQEIFYKHYALHYELTHNADVAAGTTLYVDITSSAVGLTIWQKDTLKYQQNLHIGTLRVLESFRRAQRDSYDFPKVLDEFLGRILEPIWPMLEQYEMSSCPGGNRDWSLG